MLLVFANCSKVSPPLIKIPFLAALPSPTITAVGVAKIESSPFNVNVYPNPTNGVSNLLVDLEEAGTIGITVVNILGETVYNFQSEKFSAGNYTTNVDLSNQPNGIYLAYLVVNGNQKSVRINLTK